MCLVMGASTMLLLGLTPVEEEALTEKPSSFAECVKLLGVPVVLLSFIAIACHVGVDVGINVTVPKILRERLGLTLDDAAFGTSLYFIFRTVGCFSGSAILRFVKGKVFFGISLLMVAVGLLLLFYETNRTILCVAIALVGLGNANLFSIIFATALTGVPSKQNEVSGLMIMGIVGGALFPPLMGLLSDTVGRQSGAVFVMAACTLYLFVYMRKIRV